MHKTKQIVVIAGVVVLMAVLFLQPIKGLVNEDATAAEATSTAASISFEEVSQVAKQGLNPSLISEITTLESQLKTLSGEQRIAHLEMLAEKWDDVNRPAPLAYAYQELAEETESFDYWLKAGDTYRQAYTNLSDTTLARELTDRAIRSYQQALELDGGSLDAKTGLGSAYVSGSDNPMAGIALLQEVVKIDPEHLEANKSLGLFSMQSRQFDRAIDRFRTVVDQAPDAESYFYLATSYENIGLNREAIEAFEKSKQLAADPTLTQFIDRKIEELNR